MSNTVNYPLGLNLLLDTESFLTDLTSENEAMITGGWRTSSDRRSRLRSLRSRRRSRRRPRRRSRT